MNMPDKENIPDKEFFQTWKDFYRFCIGLESTNTLLLQKYLNLFLFK